MPYDPIKILSDHGFNAHQDEDKIVIPSEKKTLPLNISKLKLLDFLGYDPEGHGLKKGGMVRGVGIAKRGIKKHKQF
jgi:hypothetical protein